MSEPDRELLEWAAKAAGMKGWLWGGTDQGVGNAWGLVRGNADGSASVWNPLLSDGDALRLAVKLRMNFRMEMPYATSAGWREREYGAPTRDGLGPWFWKEWLSDHNYDAVSATRRAIVKAAAMVGKGYPASPDGKEPA